MYVVVSFIGDYAVEAQPFWNEEYSSKSQAIDTAKVQHLILKVRPKYDNLYTIVIEKDNDEIVEWIKYRNLEIKDKVKATKLADELFGENENGLD
jgi:hypothetical protein